MARTPYDPKNAAFSNVAHKLAQVEIYPRLFGVPFDSLEFESTLVESGARGSVLDGEMAIDRIVRVQPKLPSPLPSGFKTHPPMLPIGFTIQERFRKPKHAWRKDLTITTWNHNTNLPSELYKLWANWFVYGYFDPEKRVFLDAVVVDVPKMLLAIAAGTIRYGRDPGRRNPRSNQSFIDLKFEALRASGCLIFQLSRPLVSAQAPLFAFNE